MTDTLNDLIEQARHAADALQAEIDAAIDRHGHLRRFVDAMSGPPPVEVIDTPPPPSKPKAAPKATRKPRQGGTDWPAVFDWVKAAKADGTYTLERLVAQFGTNAKNWRVRCANLGLVLDAAPPATAPASAPAPSPVVATIVDHLVAGTGNKPMIAKRAHVLACTEDDCGAEFATDKGHELHRHCLDDHGRRPYTYEKTPVLAAGPVAGVA